MKKYTLFGKNIVFDDAAERAYAIKANYEFVELRLSQEFQRWYKKQNTIQNVLSNFVSFVNTAYSELFVSGQFEKLQECGIYDMTADMYARRCLSFAGAQGALDTIESQYDAITEQQHAEKEYRDARKAARGRWQGGGFGLSGALKGAATAGALNAVSGLGHNLVNSAGNLSSALDASNAKSDLYKSASTVLLRGLHEDMRTFFDNHIQLLTTAKPGYFKFCFDEERANALFSNAKQLPDKRAALLTQAFELCPWNEDLQRYIFRNYPENRREILRVSTDFGIGIYDCVEELLRKEYTEEDKKSEERALQAKSRILKIMDELDVSETRVLNELEIDCLHRLCPDLKNANEATCNSFIEAIQAYDAQEQNKQTVIDEVNARLDEIWSVEDDAACKALYLNTDIHIPDERQRAIDRIKEKSRTKAHEPYVKALQACSEKEINSARSYRRGVVPKIYAALAWSGLLLTIGNVVWLRASMGISMCGIALLGVFGIMYLLLDNAWKTLTIDETAVHIALTEDNPPTKMKIPAFVFAIPIAAALIGAVNISYTRQAEQAEAERLQAQAEQRQQEWEAEHAAEQAENDTSTDNSEVLYDSLIDYQGEWYIPDLNNDAGGYIEFTIENRDNDYYLSASGLWEPGDYQNEIVDAPIHLEKLGEDSTYAVGTFTDSFGNTGSIAFYPHEFNGPYMTMTTDNAGEHCFNFTHLECGRGSSLDRPEVGAADNTAAEQMDTVQADAPYAYLYDYIYGLNDAINSGSAAYTEQQQLVSKLYEQGITENVISFETKSEQQDGKTAVLITDEKIGVSYADGSYQVVEQSYAYHMQLQSDGSWLIDTMTEQ